MENGSSSGSGNDSNSNNTCSLCQKIFKRHYVAFPCAQMHKYCKSCAMRTLEVGEEDDSYTFSCKKCQISVTVNSVREFEDTYGREVKTEKKLNWASGLCPFHDKQLIYFCVTCTEPLCIRCTEGYHHSHEVEAFDTVYDQTKTEFFARMEELEKERNKAEGKIQNGFEMRESFSVQMENMRASLIDGFNALRETLEKKQHDLLMQLQSVEDNKIKEYENFTTSTFRFIDDYNTIKHVAEKIAQAAGNPLSQFQIFYENQHLFDSLDDHSALLLPSKPNINLSPYKFQTVTNQINSLNLY